MSYHHIFFDLDNTITRSRTEVTSSMANLLDKLAAEVDLIVVSGAKVDQIHKQMIPLVGKFYSLGLNGNYGVDPNGQLIWQKELTYQQKTTAINVAKYLIDHWGINYRDPNDLIQDRGCQISYSPVGHNEEITIKEAFDPDHSRRREIIRQYPELFAQLINCGLEVKTGGTTCFDIYLAGSNKGSNLLELIKKMGWDKTQCIYIGDALFPGGNDESVLGIIDTKQVKDYLETEQVVTQLLSNLT